MIAVKINDDGLYVKFILDIVGWVYHYNTLEDFISDFRCKDDSEYVCLFYAVFRKGEKWEALINFPDGRIPIQDIKDVISRLRTSNS